MSVETIVVMGVTGAGKSTVGKLLATRLGLPFIEGDDFHSVANKAKMSAGIPLTDADRAPWLQALNAAFQAQQALLGCVASCSALRQTYRDTLSVGIASSSFILLDGTEAQLRERLKDRTGHYMNPNLLDSQLALLERDGVSLTISISYSPDEIVDQILAFLAKPRPAGKPGL